MPRLERLSKLKERSPWGERGVRWQGSAACATTLWAARMLFEVLAGAPAIYARHFRLRLCSEERIRKAMWPVAVQVILGEPLLEWGEIYVLSSEAERREVVEPARVGEHKTDEPAVVVEDFMVIFDCDHVALEHRAERARRLFRVAFTRSVFPARVRELGCVDAAETERANFAALRSDADGVAVGYFRHAERPPRIEAREPYFDFIPIEVRCPCAQKRDREHRDDGYPLGH